MAASYAFVLALFVLGASAFKQSYPYENQYYSSSQYPGSGYNAINFYPRNYINQNQEFQGPYYYQQQHAAYPGYGYAAEQENYPSYYNFYYPYVRQAFQKYIPGGKYQREIFYGPNYQNQNENQAYYSQAVNNFFRKYIGQQQQYQYQPIQSYEGQYYHGQNYPVVSAVNYYPHGYNQNYGQEYYQGPYSQYAQYAQYAQNAQYAY